MMLEACVAAVVYQSRLAATGLDDAKGLRHGGRVPKQARGDGLDDAKGLRHGGRVPKQARGGTFG